MEGATLAGEASEKLLRRFELMDMIAQGPRGETYLAAGRDLLGEAQREHRVVIKIMHPDAVSAHWAQQQQSLARIYHPSIVPVLEASHDERGRPYLVMPWRQGMPLDRWYASEQGRQAPAEAMVALVIDICNALETVHREGVLHLGLKPGNILIQDTDEGPAVGLVDFGLAPVEQAVTYTAPEVYASRDVQSGTIRSDVFGLGMLLLRLLSAGAPEEGRLSFEASAERLMHMGRIWLDRLHQRIESLPPNLIDTIERALRVEPSARHESAEALARELRQGLYASAGRYSLTEAVADAALESSPMHVDIRDGLIGDLMREKTARGPVLKFFLRHRDAEGQWRRSGAFFFAPRRTDPRSTYHSLNGAWAGAELSLFHARAATRDGAEFFTTDEHTLPILEPYFLVPVTDVIKSQGCASRYLVDLRDRGGTSKALVVGRVVHDMLETMARAGAAGRPAPDFDTLCDDAFRSSRLDILAAGLHIEDMARVRREVRGHYDKLCQIVNEAGRDLFEGASAEVKRFSGEYGLEGRIDLAFDDGEAFRILELKTGKPYHEHAQQVRCYALLWDKVAHSLGKQVVGELLYSKDGRLLPVDRQDVAEERKIIQARNGIVSLHRHFAFGDTNFRPPYYYEEPQPCRAAECRYRKERCKYQTLITGQGPSADPALVTRPGGVWGGVEPQLVAIARAYYARFVRFVEAEYWHATMTLGQILRGDTLEARCRALKAVAELRIARVERETERVVFAGDNIQIFSPGQRLIAHRGDFNTGQIFTGKVISAGREELVLESSAAPTARRLSPTGWILDQHPTRIGHRERHRALFDMLRTRDPQRLDVLLRRRVPTAVEEPTWLPNLDHLNEQQREAVVGAVTSKGAYLIQGPPGTGKTTVIAEIIRQLVSQGQRVLLTAGTNTAVDNVLVRLLDTGCEDFLRLGSAREDNHLWRAVVDNGRDPADFFARPMAKSAEDLEALRQTLVARPVIAATTHMAISSPVIEILERSGNHTRDRETHLPDLFDVAILDEAGQITEPMTLGSINRAKRFVLVGDHQQLPPVVVSDRALSAHIDANDILSPVEARLQEVSGVRGLDQSLFERLFGYAPTTMLEVQYRMNPALMAFSSSNFYDGRMKAGGVVQDLCLPVHKPALAALPAPCREALDPEHPLVLMNIRGREKLRQNEDEAELIVQLLDGLLNQGLLTLRGAPRHFDPAQASGEIGIISPFRAQVRLLRQMIAERLPEHAPHIEVDTVERFQGREKEIMLVSFVASDRSSAFITNARRLNVTLTRARTKLIVVGDLLSLARASSLFRDLIHQPESLRLDVAPTTDTQPSVGR